MPSPTDLPPPSTGYLLWHLSLRWRTALDRALVPLGLTSSQYGLLASLYGLSCGRRRPSQRELADFSGLERMHVSKLIRALERAGLVNGPHQPGERRIAGHAAGAAAARRGAQRRATRGALMKQMKLTVIGSTGRTGRHVLTEGVRRGHELTAFTRRPDVLSDEGVLARVIHGDGRDLDDVRTAVDGADAVIAIVTAGTRKGPHQVAEVSRAVVKAMSETGVRRLVVTSVYPIVGDRPRLPIAVLRRVFAAAYADAAAMEQTVSASDLDWTIARLNRLLDAPARGGVRISRDLLDRPTGLTRADVAATLLDIAGDDSYSRTAVNLAGAR